MGLTDSENLAHRAARNIAAMRIDRDSDWPHRLAETMGRPQYHDLTKAELEVLRLYANGLHMPDIARARGVAYQTVRTQMRTICSKLAAK